MKEETNSDLFSFLGKVSIICITTNGDIKKDGTAVMGKGVALEAKKLFPTIPICLAEHLKLHGNFPGHLLSSQETSIFSFPVKRHWNEDASLGLIKRSAFFLKAFVNVLDKEEESLSIVLPRPGCGAGNLSWENVKPILDEIFDDRFLIISK